jgi:3-hydroxyisobutyrate dehydrogenase-like beta-hydroxyacid dehydrogenase
MSRKRQRNVGIIGLGLIGSRVAACLRAAGFNVYVWSRTPRAEPNFLGSPAQVADSCDVIQLFVSDADALFRSIDGLADRLMERHIIVCNATVGPEATMEAARRVTERGARFLDAPFTGSRNAAEKAGLVYYIGGDDDVLKRAEPILRASSKAIVKIGAIGQAAIVKIATNMLVAVTVQTLAESLALIKRSGVHPSLLQNAIEHHALRSVLCDMKLPMMIEGDFEPHFSLKNMFKDVQIAIHAANTFDIDLPATTATAGVMYGGLNRGWGEADFSVLAHVYEENAAAAVTMDEAAPAPPGPVREIAPVESLQRQPEGESSVPATGTGLVEAVDVRPMPAEPPVAKVSPASMPPAVESPGKAVSSAPAPPGTESTAKPISPVSEAPVIESSAKPAPPPAAPSVGGIGSLKHTVAPASKPEAPPAAPPATPPAAAESASPQAKKEGRDVGLEWAKRHEQAGILPRLFRRQAPPAVHATPPPKKEGRDVGLEWAKRHEQTGILPRLFRRQAPPAVHATPQPKKEARDVGLECAKRHEQAGLIPRLFGSR